MESNRGVEGEDGEEGEASWALVALLCSLQMFLSFSTVWTSVREMTDLEALNREKME